MKLFPFAILVLFSSLGLAASFWFSLSGWNPLLVYIALGSSVFLALLGLVDVCRKKCRSNRWLKIGLLAVGIGLAYGLFQWQVESLRKKQPEPRSQYALAVCGMRYKGNKVYRGNRGGVLEDGIRNTEYGMRYKVGLL